MRSIPPAGRALAAILAAGPLAGCDTLSNLNPFDRAETYKPVLVADVPAEQLYNEGLARLSKSDFEGAAKRFEKLDKQYPQSTWSRKAMLMTTFAHYEGRNYDDAVSSGRRFLAQYATTEDAPYAAYLVGMSYYNQVPDVTRDQERAEKALAAFLELVQRWPKSEYAEDAKFKIQVTRDQLAGKEMEVGRYYLNKRNYTAAINRFRTVVAQYQTTRHAEEALARLTEAYMSLGVSGEAQTAAAVLGHNFPDSSWYKDSFRLLQSGGLEPREDQGSWISKAFRKVGLG